MKCRLCSGEDTNLLFFANDTHGRHILSHDRFAIYNCKNCKVTFTDIHANNEYYKKYYPENYYCDEYRNALLNRTLALLKKISFFKKEKLILKYKPKGNRILEIGCAKGDFLHSLPAYFEKYGIEINEIAYQYVKNHYSDITVYNTEVDSRYFSTGDIKFDIIVMWHVLEHVANPRAFIKALSNLIAEDGVIIFDVPNRNSLGFNLTKEAWFHLDAPRHLFYFNFESLKGLLGEYNLRIATYSAQKFDYFHDLSSSFLKMFETKKNLLNIMIAIPLIPAVFLIRLIFALFFPGLAEINTYVVTR